MSNGEQPSEEKNFIQILEEKSRIRNEHIAAVYAASAADLELAATAIKSVLRGSGPIARPRRFSSIND